MKFLILNSDYPEFLHWLYKDTGTMYSTFDAEEATGVLVPIGNAEMAEAIELLLANEVLRKRLGENAFRDVQKRFDLVRQAKSYI